MAVEPRQLKRYIVRNCVLKILPTSGDDSRKARNLPVASFNVTYMPGSAGIPTATVIPALGRGLGARPDIITLKGVRERDKCELELTIREPDKTERVVTLIAGFITNISSGKSASGESTRLSAQIRISHSIVRLAGAPSTSYVYAAKTGNSLETLHTNKTKLNIFSPGGNNASLMPVESFLHKTLQIGKPAILHFPGEFLREALRGLLTEFGNQVPDEEIDDLIRTYDPSNLTSVIRAPTNFFKKVCNKFATLWRSDNSWQALVKTTEHIYMQVIPFNKGVYLAAPYSLDRQPQKVLRATDIASISRVRTGSISEPVDGVVMIPPAGMRSFGTIGISGEVFTFPERIRPNESVLKGTTEDKYYHFRSYPSWIQPTANLLNTSIASGQAFGPSPKGDEGESLLQYFTLIGTLLARATYGQLRQRKVVISVLLPFRTDLMPGTIVAVENTDENELSFIGDTLYGMITETEYFCDTSSENPRLGVKIKVMSIRNEKDNATDELTFDGHPLYEKRWVGTNLDGTFIGPTPTNIHTPEGGTPNDDEE